MLYINTSTATATIRHQYSEAINRRLSNIEEALKKNGYDHQLNFDPQPPKPKRSRNRDVIWFNPPYSANVATNIGYKFLRTIDECFPKDHPLHKIFNRNTLKLRQAIVACPTCKTSSRPTTNQCLTCKQKTTQPKDAIAAR